VAGERLVRLSEEEAERLARLYMQAELEILRELDRAMARGLETRYLRSLLDNVQAIIEGLVTGSRTWCEQAIPRVYLAGAETADAQVKALGRQVSIGFGAVHQQAVKVLADATFQRLTDAAGLIGRRVEDVYRRVALEATRQSIIGAKDWRSVARDYQARLRAEGITSFRDAAGREWNMRTYSEMVARTTTMEAHIQGTGNRLLEGGFDLVKVSSHLGACEKCAPWEGRVLSLTGKTPGYPTMDEARAAGLFHPNCFPGSVLVSGPAPLASMTRWYEGKLVIIHTAGGVELPVTPNHPILTPEGWVPAGRLMEGQYVICYLRHKRVDGGRDPNDVEVPARIEDVARSFGQSGSVAASAVPVAPEDFHGDGMGSEICVVRTDGLLRNGVEATLAEPVCQDYFALAAAQAGVLSCGSSPNKLVQRNLAAADSGVSCLSKAAPFRRSCPVQTSPHCSGAIRGSRNPVVSKAPLDRHLVDPEVLRDGLLGLPGEIAPQDSFAVQRKTPSQPSLGQAPCLHAVPAQDALDSTLGETEIPAKLIERLPGEISSDKIVLVEVEEFAGHVYNLQTVEGWYGANTIIAHNCRHAYGLSLDLESAPSAAERIPVKTVTGDAAKGASQAIQDAVDHGLKNGTECLHLTDLKGKVMHAPVVGTKNLVVFPKSFVDILETAPQRSLLMSHNHPRSSSFSDSDLSNLWEYASLQGLFVAGHDGTRYYIGRKASTPTLDPVQFWADYQRLNMKHHGHFQAEVSAGRMTADQAWKEHSHRIVQDLAAENDLEYVRWSKP